MEDQQITDRSEKVRAEDATVFSDGETDIVNSGDDLIKSIEDESIIGITGRILFTSSGSHDDVQTILIVEASKANRSGYMFRAIETPDVPQQLQKAYSCYLHPPHLQNSIHVVISTRSGTGLAGT